MIKLMIFSLKLKPSFKGLDGICLNATCTYAYPFLGTLTYYLLFLIHYMTRLYNNDLSLSIYYVKSK